MLNWWTFWNYVRIRQIDSSNNTFNQLNNKKCWSKIPELEISVNLNSMKKEEPELGDLAEGKLPSRRSMRKVTGRLISHDRKKRNSLPVMWTVWIVYFNGKSGSSRSLNSYGDENCCQRNWSSRYSVLHELK